MLVPSIFSKNFVDDLFDDAFPFGRNLNDRFPQAGTTAMNADVQEFEDRYQLELELPGLKKENIQAELKDGYLLINAKHETDSEEKDEKGKYIRKERYYGSYQRSFYVGNAVKQEDIKASFENGILALTVPKMEANSEVEEKHLIEIEG